MIGEYYILSARIKKKISAVFGNAGDNVLDLGCGQNPGYHKSMKGNTVCFDNHKTKKIHVIGDADVIPFKKASFDKVICINSFYYFKNPFNVARDLSAVLKKSGKLVIVMPFFYPIHDVPFDNYRFTEHGIETVLQDYFKIEKIEPIGGIFSIPSVILHSIIKGVPLMFPAFLKPAARILSYIVFYIPYLVVQLLGILDFLDRTKRFPIYYFILASKK